MGKPRQIIPGRTYFLTRRVVERRFLLRPDAQLSNAYLYCLIEAARRFGIQLLLSLAESNHHHTVFRDPRGNAPRFVEHFHRTLARCLNCYRGRWENFWAAGEPCYEVILDRDTLVRKLVYAAANPVKDHLVERAHQWPGVNTMRALRGGHVVRATRPRFFFDPNGAMPEAVEAVFALPAGTGDELFADPAELIAAVEAGIAEVEGAARAERARTGRRVLGRKTICEQSWRDAPTSVAPRRQRRPRFAGRTASLRVALAAYRQFLALYQRARAAWATSPKAAVLFPLGTYALARSAPVAVAPLPT
jgi:putative transposase